MDRRAQFPALEVMDNVEKFITDDNMAGLDHFVKNFVFDSVVPFVVVAMLRSSFRKRHLLPSWKARLELAEKELGDRADFSLRGLWRDSRLTELHPDLIKEAADANRRK
jgi:hypothetical protein